MSINYIWKPSKISIEQSNIFKMMQEHGFENYDDFWKWSVTNKETFWEATIQNLGIEFAQIIIVFIVLFVGFLMQTVFRFSKRDWIMVVSAIVIGLVIPMLLNSDLLT